MRTIRVVAAVIREGGRIFATARGYGAYRGKWEFPGGKIEKGETPEAALERELFEELGVKTQTGRIYYAIHHSYPEKDVLLLFYRSSLIEGEPHPIEEADIRWIEEGQLREFDWAEADAPLIDLIANDGFGALNDI